MRVQFCRARRNCQVKLIQVNVVAAPLDWLSIDGKHDTGNRVHRSRGPMVARNPPWCCQSKRPDGYWQINIGVIHLARCVCQIGGDLDWFSLRKGRRSRAQDEKAREQGSVAAEIEHRRWHS